MELNRHALRVIRQRSGLSVSALAAVAGISQPHLSNIETGRRRASPEVALRLARALKVPLLALLSDPTETSEAGESGPIPPAGSRRCRGRPSRPRAGCSRRTRRRCSWPGG